MRLATSFFGLHLLALAFGLAGILIAMPHPELWAGNAALAQVYSFGMQRGGAGHILMGTAAMLAFGLYAIGARKTALFFVAGTLLPLGAELLGTGTGWPFGGYAYNDFLGAKVAGRVPYSVPLSWFYMGFAAFLLAPRIAAALGMRQRAWVNVALGAWLLTAWDLVLDPAMANPSMPLTFWVWHERGPYFGMPLSNLAGWLATGLAFMALSRLLWREDVEPRRIPAWLPLALYSANVAWAMVLSLSVGLWPTAVAAIVLGLAPASLAYLPDARRRWGAGDRSDSLVRSRLVESSTGP